MRGFLAGAEYRSGSGETRSGPGIRVFETEERGREGQEVLLRHVSTGYYYRGSQEWVLAPADAKSFPGTDDALEVVGAQGLDGVSIVPRPENRGSEWVFALSPIVAEETGARTIQ